MYYSKPYLPWLEFVLLLAFVIPLQSQPIQPFAIYFGPTDITSDTKYTNDCGAYPYAGQSLSLWSWREGWKGPPCPTTCSDASQEHLFYTPCQLPSCKLAREQNYTFWIQYPTNSPLTDVTPRSLPCTPYVGRPALQACVQFAISPVVQSVFTSAGEMTRRYITMRVDLNGGFTPFVQVQYEVTLTDPTSNSTTSLSSSSILVINQTNFASLVYSGTITTNLAGSSSPCTFTVGLSPVVPTASFQAVSVVLQTNVVIFVALLVLFVGRRYRMRVYKSHCVFSHLGQHPCMVYNVPITPPSHTRTTSG